MIRCFRDKKGWRRADVGTLPNIVAAYLEQDIQDDIADCLELEKAVEDIQTDKAVRWSGTGNTHSILIDKR